MVDRPIVLERVEVHDAAMMALARADDETRSPESRAIAESVYRNLDRALRYGTGQDVDFQVAPIGLQWDGFFTDVIEEQILDLGGEDYVRQQNPAHLAMVRRAAGLCDNRSYTTDFRLDALDALGKLIDTLKGMMADV